MVARASLARDRPREAFRHGLPDQQAAAVHFEWFANEMQVAITVDREERILAVAVLQAHDWL